MKQYKAITEDHQVKCIDDVQVQIQEITPVIKSTLTLLHIDAEIEELQRKIDELYKQRETIYTEAAKVKLKVM